MKNYAEKKYHLYLKLINLKVRILVPLSLALICLLSVFTFSIYKYYHKDITEHIKDAIPAVQNLMTHDVEGDAGLMKGVLEALRGNSNLRIALREKDRESLLRYATPLFERLRTEHHITHFYFSDPDRINILRIHQPDRYGDRIDRFTTLQAEKTGKAAHGIELGPLGTFTLRTVVPWYEGATLIGYVELGEEIEHIVHKLRNVLCVEICVFIEKRFLARKGWEDGMKMLGRNGDWDCLPSSAVTYQTLDFDGNSLARILSLREDKSASRILNIFLADRDYYCSFLPLTDASSHNVGEILILEDVTFQKISAVHAIYTNTAIGGMIGGVLILLFYWISARVENKLKISHRKLLDETHKRELIQEKHVKELEHLALHDILTGLPNRYLLHDRLQHEINVCRRKNTTLTLILIDIDRFQEINDTLGHHIGDRVLQQTAARLRDGLRESDTVARIGADEFCVMFQNTGAESLTTIVQKIAHIFEPPFVLEDIPLDIEVSMGAAFYPEHSEDAAVLIQHVDVAMHLAKNNKTVFAVYDANKDMNSVQRLKLITGLRRAVSSKDEIVLYCQPKVTFHSSSVTDTEILVRWQHPEHGIIQPGEFIPIAERTGLIQSLTLCILEKSLRQCREWLHSGLYMRIAVNLSVRNLHDHRLLMQVEEFLKVNDIEPNLLTLEITESAIMSDPPHAIDVLSKLKRLGILLAIDDFGTGYSSLAYLSKLPVDELKIDQSFVCGMGKNKNDFSIVRSIIELGHNLNLKVIAEGVEDGESWNHLADLGCDMVQGHYISHPLPTPEFVQWLNESRWKRRDA